MHYDRWHKTGDLGGPEMKKLMGRPVMERLRRHGWVEVVRREELGPCWEWGGMRDKNGYGRISVNKVPALAHRVMYRESGRVIPEGLGLLHACDNPPCINPDHLSPGTHLENMQDAARKGRMPGRPSAFTPEETQDTTDGNER
jgi:hypothetical protein